MELAAEMVDMVMMNRIITDSNSDVSLVVVVYVNLQ